MPELPEVETIVQELKAAQLIGKKIIRAQVCWPRTVELPALDQFLIQIQQQSILEISRRGKYIVFQLSGGYLLVHLRMTGKFLLTSPAHHERIRLYLDDGSVLYYADQRKFGRFVLVKTLERLAALGIDPLDPAFTLDVLKSLVHARARQIKPFLLDQRYIAGLGNIYVDEALWEAKIHPQRLASTLSEQEVRALYSAIPAVLKKGIQHRGTSLGAHQANYFSLSGRRGGNQYALKVFQRHGEPCPRCGQPLIKLRIAQRGTHLCPICQP